MEPGQSFRHDGAHPSLTADERRIVAEFTRLYYRQWWHDRAGGRGTVSIGWLGHLAQKCPTDLWTVQEIVVETQPDLIVECGTCLGGSGLFLASVCEAIGRGRVISIDVAQHSHRPQHPRLSYLAGDSAAPAVVDRVRGQIEASARVMVILDSDHRRDHVAAELAAYADLVSPGCYLVVEDTAINGHPIEDGFGPGPAEALDAFLAGRPDFVVDRSRERFLLTLNPGGFLRRLP